MNTKKMNLRKQDFTSRFDNLKYLGQLDLKQIEQSYMPVMEEKLLMTAMDLDEKNYERLAILDRNQKTRHFE